MICIQTIYSPIWLMDHKAYWSFWLMKRHMCLECYLLFALDMETKTEESPAFLHLVVKPWLHNVIVHYNSSYIVVRSCHNYWLSYNQPFHEAGTNAQKHPVPAGFLNPNLNGPSVQKSCEWGHNIELLNLVLP